MRKLLYTLSIVSALLMVAEVAMAQPKHGVGLRYNFYNYVSPRFSDFDKDEAGLGDVFSEIDGGGIEVYYDHRIARNTFIEIPVKFGTARVPRKSIDNNPSEDNHSLFSMDALVKHTFFRYGNRVNPYVHFGVGFTSDSEDNEDTDLNIPLGIGLNVRIVDNWYATLQTQYRTSTERREGWHHGIGVQYNFGDDLYDDELEAEMGKEGNGDRDGDGITDNLDLCPDAPGTAALSGCPDRDGDGVADKDDRCPDTRGTVANGGCPEMDRADVLILEEAIKVVEFETAKATLLPASLPTLNEVARLMKKYPGYNLQIDGHTDNTGDDKLNLKLSEDRAKTCYDYLAGKGVEARRMKYAGYGESRPIGDNNTAEGRELNRRVEFKMSVK